MSELHDIRLRFIETAGHFTQSLGIGRTLGQIYAHLYFSPRPQTLDDLAGALRISKGGASMAARQLEQWGAVRRLWVQGDRKDYYEATEDFGRIVRKGLFELIGQRMETADGLLEEAETALRSPARQNAASEDREFLRGRVARLRAFRARAQRIWDSTIVKMLLK